MKVQIPALLAVCVAIAACSPTPNMLLPSLAESLAGKTPEERKEILWDACLNEAAWKATSAGRHSSQ